MTTRDIVHIALFAALTAALGLFPPLTIPALGVPITAQSMGAMLAGGILGARHGGLAIALFLALVAMGLPLLAGGRGGLGVFAGPSGGFLIGMAAGAVVTGWLVERFAPARGVAGALAASIIGGIGVVYACGIPWLAFAAQLSLPAAAAGSAAFIPGDILKAAVAAGVIATLARAYPLSRERA